eukprot:5594930-Amphidinium_carterae.1
MEETQLSKSSFGVGLVFTPARASTTKTALGRCWSPAQSCSVGVVVCTFLMGLVEETRLSTHYEHDINHELTEY